MRHIKAAERAIELYNLSCDPYDLQLVANKIARKYGTNAATQIIINRSFKSGNGKVREYTRYGWRKYTTSAIALPPALPPTHSTRGANWVGNSSDVQSQLS